MAISRIETNSIAPSQTLTTPIIATTMGVGGATPSGSGSGITFPATQSASIDANTLDDYEEGTWTPVLNGTGSNPTYSGGSSSIGGYYVKVGRVVTVGWEVRWTSLSGGGGNVFISGLPFSRLNGQAGVLPDGDRSICEGYNITISGVQLGQSVSQGNSTIGLDSTISAGATQSLTIGNLPTSAIAFLRGTLTYFTNS